MDERHKNRLVDRFLGLISAAVVALASFWFGSFASDKEVMALENQVKVLEEKKADKKELAKIKTGIKILASGFCIMDKKTCEIKKDIERELK